MQKVAVISQSTNSQSDVVVIGLGVYEKLSGHQAGPVPRWLDALCSQFWDAILPGYSV